MVGVIDTRTDAVARSEVECLPSTAVVAELSSGRVLAPPSPPRVVIKPERSAQPPLVRVRRFAFLDGLRAFGAQVIVWHHLTFYGPLSDIAYPLMPTLIDVLFRYGAMAVQVFLVIGGFVAAHGLTHNVPTTPEGLIGQIAKRYWRLAWPYLAVLGIAVIANSLASGWMTAESLASLHLETQLGIPDYSVRTGLAAPPTVLQVVAHAFFLQTLLGYESLSAGIWYLAIDFQLSLFSLVSVSLVHLIAARCGRERKGISWSFAVFFPLAGLALFRWNRDPGHDFWCGYYFGSYFLGMATAWWLSGTVSRGWYGAYLALMTAALIYDVRVRLAIALVTGLAIAIAGASGGLERWFRSPAMDYLSRTSYSLFLIHFPVCLVVNAVLSEVVAGQPWLAFGGMVLAWVASCLAAVAVYHGMEKAVRW